jgi:antitoxin VapB
MVPACEGPAKLRLYSYAVQQDHPVPKLAKTRVFMSGRSQHVTIPAEFRFATDEVYVRRDPHRGDLILSPAPKNWKDVFAALDAAGFPDDFMEDRDQDTPDEREPL